METAWKKVCDRGIVNIGDLTRFAKVMKQAQAGGKKLKIGFIGGSITQGSLATQPTLCYAYHTFEWWQENFPNTEFEYINAGIGATTSQFGVARVESDLLAFEPDVVFLEFSVNDTNNEFFKETFEGTVRKILKKQVALFMFNNVQYNDGVNAQQVHNEIGKAYGLPIVTMKESIYAEITAGNINAPDITPDNLHPNDKGHRMVADVICNLLDKIKVMVLDGNAQNGCGCEAVKSNSCGCSEELPAAMTSNRFENSLRFRNQNLPNGKWEGFAVDTDVQDGVKDIFKNGWRSATNGAYIETELDDVSFISVQFRRTIKQPAPIAKAVVDGDESKAVILDGNFDETWGDCLTMQDIAKELPRGKHTLKITITDVPENAANDFYFVSVITA